MSCVCSSTAVCVCGMPVCMGVRLGCAVVMVVGKAVICTGLSWDGMCRGLWTCPSTFRSGSACTPAAPLLPLRPAVLIRPGHTHSASTGVPEGYHGLPGRGAGQGQSAAASETSASKGQRCSPSLLGSSQWLHDEIYGSPSGPTSLICSLLGLSG